MKALVFACVFFSVASFAEEYQLKNGSKIKADFLKYQPGVISFRLNGGGTTQMPEDGFSWEVLSKLLPSNNVYFSYLSLSKGIDDMGYKAGAQISELTTKFEGLQKNSQTVAKKYDDIVSILIRYEKAGLLREDMASEISNVMSGKKPKKEIENKTGVPDEVFDVICMKAKKEWPDDFQMQVFSIENQVKAYKHLNSLK